MRDYDCNYSARDSAWQWDGAVDGARMRNRLQEVIRLLREQPDPTCYREFARRRSLHACVAGFLDTREACEIARRFLGVYPVPRETGCLWGDQCGFFLQYMLRPGASIEELEALVATLL